MMREAHLDTGTQNIGNVGLMTDKMKMTSQEASSHRLHGFRVLSHNIGQRGLVGHFP
jgi:hypothetical protein